MQSHCRLSRIAMFVRLIYRQAVSEEALPVTEIQEGGMVWLIVFNADFFSEEVTGGDRDSRSWEMRETIRNCYTVATRTTPA